jgi:hypothetical protein
MALMVRYRHCNHWTSDGRKIETGRLKDGSLTPAVVNVSRSISTTEPSGAKTPTSRGDKLNTFNVYARFIAGRVASKVPGVKLDLTQVTSFMVVASTSALTATWKWLQGWHAHDQLVAQGNVEPRKQAHVRRNKASSAAHAPAGEAWGTCCGRVTYQAGAPRSRPLLVLRKTSRALADAPMLKGDRHDGQR